MSRKLCIFLERRHRIQNLSSIYYLLHLKPKFQKSYVSFDSETCFLIVCKLLDTFLDGLGGNMNRSWRSDSSKVWFDQICVTCNRYFEIGIQRCTRQWKLYGISSFLVGITLGLIFGVQNQPESFVSAFFEISVTSVTSVFAQSNPSDQWPEWNPSILS